MEGKKKQIAMRIFLSGIFALLITYIGVWVYDVVSRTGAFVDNESEDPTYACIGYMFDARFAEYSDGELSFELVNRKYSDYTITNIGVISDMNEYVEKDIGRLVPGKAKRVIVEIPVNTTFKVFPLTCDLYGKVIELE